MRITLIIITLLISSITSAQVDVSGEWYGTSIFLKDQTGLRYELKQEDDDVSGFGYTKSSNGKDSTKISLEGKVSGGQVSIKGVEFIYRVGMACLANVDLKYSKTENIESLNGRWKGDLGISTCPPMTSGSVILYKEKKPVVIVSSNQAKASSISDKDDIGNVLLNQLSKRKYHALIIGVEEYLDDEIDDLDHPVSDAQQLSDVLINYYSFNEEDVVLLQNPKREHIIEELDRLSDTVAETENLLIFYAGHGIWNEQLNQGYWLPSNASVNSKSYWLSNSTLRDYVGGINSKHTLLISDACFSGGILKERAVFNDSRAVLEVYKLPSRKAMTSGTLKTVPDKSIFMQYLIKNLESNQSPLLSADQLFRNFKTAVINNSPNGQVPQYGPISQSGDEGGDFVFLRKK